MKIIKIMPFHYVAVTFAALLLLAASVPSAAKEIAGVELADELTTSKGDKLALNGAGIRTKFFMDIYAGGLYLSEASSDASVIIMADKPQALRLHMVSGLITSEKMSNATEEGFENSMEALKLKVSQDQIKEMISVFKETINKGDVFDLVYVPGKGVEIYKNEKLKKVMGDLNFKQALFGIWLSEKPAHKKLKKGMLGNK